MKNREFSRAWQKFYVSLDLIRMTGSDWLRRFFDTTLISDCSELNIITNNDFVLEDSYCPATLFHSLRTVYQLICSLFFTQETCQAYVLQNRFLNSEILEFNKLRANDSQILRAQAV